MGSDSSVVMGKDASAVKGKDRLGALRPFVIISTSYLLYTVTDGAIRMIVLLFAFDLGFSALEVAIMFTLYEVGGVVTNLLAGIAGSRWGIRNTLLTGLFLQVGGIGMLYGWKEGWTKQQGIIYVVFAQMLAGIAKDLTKLGGKTVAKLVTPDEKQSSLFKLVAFITGFKNSLKGAGYFLGAATVGVSLNLALSILLGLIFIAMPWAAFGLDPQLGRSTGKKVTLRDVFKMNYNINVLSAARMFLFGARDAWFEVPLPFFLRDSINGLGWERALTGLFLAVFIIVYGQMQSWSPHLILGPLGQVPANKLVAVLWASLLGIMPAVLGPVILFSSVFQERIVGLSGELVVRNVDGMTAIITSAVAFFCLVFAVNSAVHSYLVLRYADSSKVAVNVGFYYMSNAMGRLVGTILSGVLYSFAGSTRTDGFGWCFIASAAFVAVCTVLTVFIRDDEAGLTCGAFTCVRPASTASPHAAQADSGTEVHRRFFAPPAAASPPLYVGHGVARPSSGGQSALVSSEQEHRPDTTDATDAEDEVWTSMAFVTASSIEEHRPPAGEGVQQDAALTSIHLPSAAVRSMAKHEPP